MSIFYDPGDRYRRRAVKRITSRIVVFCLLFITFGFGYWLGGLSSQKSIFMLQQEKLSADEQVVHMQEEMTKIRAEAQTSNIRLEQMRASYEEVLPEGPIQNLVGLLRKQLDEGIDEKRLESVILSARPPQNCTEAENKRFVIVTPIYKGPGSEISIESGVVVVTGKGMNVVNSKNAPEAWYDAGKPVEITFKTSEGKSEIKTGVLPLYHSVVAGAREYRFTIAAGEQSFAKVTYDSCDYP